MPAAPRWPQRCKQLCRLLGTELPLLQAPMAGVSNPAFAAAASEAGILGSHGVAYKPASQIRDDVAAISNLTARSFNINLFAKPSPACVPPASTYAEAHEALRPYHQHLGLDHDAEVLPTWQQYTEQLRALFPEGGPHTTRVLSYTFGALDSSDVAAIQKGGTVVLGTATTVEEARHLEATGVDAIIAQGSEAGGHRGSFLGDFTESLLGTMTLVPQVVSAVSVPVVAAGGIMDGRGIACAISLGASGVALGTAFISCPESSAAADYRAALTDGRAERTLVTPVFSGRHARAVANRFSDEMAGKPIAPFPVQSALTRTIKQKAAEQDPSLATYFVGQGAPHSRGLPVADLVRVLVQETADAVAEWSEEDVSI